MEEKRIIDLSLEIYHNNPGYFPYQLTEFSLEKIKPRDGYTSERVAFNTHTATHIDAPYHHITDGKSIDEMDLSLFCGPAIPIDLFGIAPHAEIGPNQLEKYDEKIRRGDIVMLCTGFGEKRGWNSEYCDNWPYLSVKGADWLAEKGVKGIVIDVMSLGGPRDGEALYQHEMLLGKEIWIGEEYRLPRELLEHERWMMYSFPLKLKGCSGAPVRAVAISE
ncbi:MAG: cyclase family protein [Christensenella sp.]|nr:cyclase family protein [Christensenella sp.]